MNFQPPIRWWGSVWRYTLAAIISTLAWSALWRYQWGEVRPWFWLDLGLGLVSFVLLRWRRAYPLPITLLINLFAMVSSTSGGPALLALTSLATRRRWREIVPASIFGFVSGIVQLVVDPGRDQWAILIPLTAALTAVAVAVGMYVGSRRELLATLRDRADRAEAEQALRVSQARTSERARIAREMHDVMAHRISLVTMHAGALAYRDDLAPEQVKETAELIQQTSHQALTELREVLGVLRSDDHDIDDRPQPSANDLAQLFSEVEAAGLTVRTSIEAPLELLPVTLGRALYRIVQESLTNARKHAGGAAVTVAVSGTPGDALRFVICNPLPFGRAADTTGAGLGLVGLSERASLVGGELSHGATAETFAVEGWLPWPT